MKADDALQTINPNEYTTLESLLSSLNTDIPTASRQTTPTREPQYFAPFIKPISFILPSALGSGRSQNESGQVSDVTSIEQRLRSKEELCMDPPVIFVPQKKATDQPQPCLATDMIRIIYTKTDMGPHVANFLNFCDCLTALCVNKTIENWLAWNRNKSKTRNITQEDIEATYSPFVKCELVRDEDDEREHGLISDGSDDDEYDARSSISCTSVIASTHQLQRKCITYSCEVYITPELRDEIKKRRSQKQVPGLYWFLRVKVSGIVITRNGIKLRIEGHDLISNEDISRIYFIRPAPSVRLNSRMSSKPRRNDKHRRNNDGYEDDEDGQLQNGSMINYDVMSVASAIDKASTTSLSSSSSIIKRRRVDDHHDDMSLYHPELPPSSQTGGQAIEQEDNRVDSKSHHSHQSSVRSPNSIRPEPDAIAAPDNRSHRSQQLPQTVTHSHSSDVIPISGVNEERVSEERVNEDSSHAHETKPDPIPESKPIESEEVQQPHTVQKEEEPIREEPEVAAVSQRSHHSHHSQRSQRSHQSLKSQSESPASGHVCDNDSVRSVEKALADFDSAQAQLKKYIAQALFASQK